jgi:alkanesulfonate monooxygenase SsuD/methylene tetrahydromethanopterin reductase-like flavin-dependent oxidoreductase (luciferase family)
MGQRGAARAGIPTPEEAKAFAYTEPELDYLAYVRSRSIFGNPYEVRDRLEELGAAYGVDELVCVTITHSVESRQRSYELLAKVFELVPGPGNEASPS